MSAPLPAADLGPASARCATFCGRASLAFAVRGSATVLTAARVDAPLKVVRPFSLPGGGLVVPLITLGPGLCAGDANAIDITAADGARAVVTMTAATRVLSMDPRGQASQTVRITAGHGALVEYYPGLTIPFPGSAFVQTIDVEAVADARVGILETWALGRTARNEYLRFRRLWSRTTVRVDGLLTYADATYVEPQIIDAAGAGVLDGRRYLASGFWYGATLCPGAADPRPDEPVLMAFAQAAPRQVYLRALSDDGPALDETVRGAIASVSTAWNVEPVVLDRFKC